MPLPHEHGWEAASVRERLEEWHLGSGLARCDRNWFDEGPHLVSTAELPWGDEARSLAVHAYSQFIHGEMWDTGEGGRAMQADIVATIGALLGAEDAAGILTVGGSESVLCALAAAKAGAFAKRYPHLSREQRYPRPFVSGSDQAAREFSTVRKSVVLPSYAHYSAFKACALFDLEPIVVAPARGSVSTVLIDDVRAAVREDTIAIYATAGTFPYGTIDPVPGMAAVAREHDVYLHVDACFGGYIIPFLERAGYYRPPLDPWDFRVDGVCSISADLHKNGMAPPPVSSLFFRDSGLLEDLASLAPPFGTLTGTRATGPIAGAWAMLARLGIEGYAKVSLESMRLRDHMVAGLTEIPGIKVVDGSKINLFAFYSDWIDLRPVADLLRSRGWGFATKSVPAPLCVAVCTLPQNHGQVAAFIDDVAWAVETGGVALADPVEGSDDGTYGGIRS